MRQNQEPGAKPDTLTADQTRPVFVLYLHYGEEVLRVGAARAGRGQLGRVLEEGVLHILRTAVYGNMVVRESRLF
jgi:hypothetical protein